MKKKLLIGSVLVFVISMVGCGTKESDVGKGGIPANDVTIGGYVSFGSYEQDNNKKNGKEEIEWLVLEVEEDKALLLSRYALDRVAYHEVEDEEVTWGECSLRKWLNDDFYKEAFSTAERNGIIESTIQIYDEGDNIGEGECATTQDKVFLLSVEEAWDYFEDGEEIDERGYQCNYSRAAHATEYALSKQKIVLGEFHDWWVYSTGKHYADGALVCNDGEIREGFTVLNECYVRPAIWVSLVESSEAEE